MLAHARLPHRKPVGRWRAAVPGVGYLGYAVIRFTNREVFNQCEAAIVQHIAEECQRNIDEAMLPSSAS